MKVCIDVGLTRDLYICIAYFSPESSTVWSHLDSTDPFPALLQDIAEAQTHGDVLVSGDFNAHTSNLPDFIQPEDEADILTGHLPSPQPLPANISTRQSSHKGVRDAFGRNLLYLCQDSNMLILNGRAVGDEQGHLNCHNANGASLVDNFIASPRIIDLNPSMHVQPQFPESDHNPLLLQLPLQSHTSPPHDGCTLRKPVKLKCHPSKVEQFRTTLAHALHFHFDLSTPTPSQCTLQECIISAASQSHGHTRLTMPNFHPQPSQAWYDDECRLLAQQLCRLPHDSPDYHTMRKRYRMTTRRKHRQHQLAQQERLCEQACQDAHAFWRTYRKRSTVVNSISPERWQSGFANLLGGGADSACSHEQHSQAQGEHLELNATVTVEEIVAASKRLKCHKAAGIDGIKAEFLLDAEDLLTLPLTACFTQMLTGRVPQSWDSGVIHSIYKSDDSNDPNNYRGITVTSVLAKLFAMVLEARMSAWAEENCMRAQGQAGFRKDYYH